MSTTQTPTTTPTTTTPTTTTPTTTTPTTTTPTTTGQAIKGPVPGMTFEWIRPRTVSGQDVAIQVTPSFLKTPISLRRARLTSQGFKLQLGGVLNQQVLPEATFGSGTAGRVTLFDSAPYDNKIDSFFLPSFTFDLPSLKLFGLQADNVKLNVKDLSNHSDLAAAAKAAPGAWIGSATLTGSKVSFPSIPQLSITSQEAGQNAFTGHYNLTTGDITLKIGKAAYASPRLTASLSAAQLDIKNSRKDWTLKGSGSLSLPGLGIGQLDGTLNFSMLQGKPSRLKADLIANTPITSLGLAGKLTVDHRFATRTGSITLADASLNGIKLAGSLNYSQSGDPAVDQVTGQLTVDNATKRGALSFGDQKELSLLPLKGVIDYKYYPSGSATPGGSLSFTGVEADVYVGAVRLPFAGNLKFDLVTGGRVPVLSELSLNLREDVTVEIENIGTVKFSGKSVAQPASFTLAKINGLDGLWPSFSGTLEVKSPGSGAFVSASDLTYSNDPDFGWGWEVGSIKGGATLPV